MWHCRCDCGSEVLVSGSNLSKGCTKSCGCLASDWASHMGGNPEFVRVRAEKAVKHGGKRRGQATAEYKTWLAMKSRCYRASDKSFAGWGGRGIKVCDRWVNDFPAFLADMGEKPTPQHTIDRIDSDRDYSPDNCRWATPAEQGGENRRGIIPITVRGTQFPSIAAACRHYGVSPTKVNERMKAGIATDDVFTIERLRPRRTRESYWRKDRR